jgi:AraC-like DNA-binding protein
MADQVTAVQYSPHDDAYHLDVEVIDAKSLRTRVAKHPYRGFERVDFQCFLFVRSGHYTHTVDFETHECTAGSCLVIGPGQVHRFGPPSDWDGWMLVVGSHHVPNSVENLPGHVGIPESLAPAVVELFERMTSDAGLPVGHARLGQLLALEAQVLVRRLALGDTAAMSVGLVDPNLLERYREYRAAVDKAYQRWHLVEPYTRQLGCSARTLNRACRAGGDTTAKRVIVERIILEAKRLLAHSRDPVTKISIDLGFDEPTNFVKFFRRETNQTPSTFRSTVHPADEPPHSPG